MFADEEFGAGKVQWLRQFSQFDFSSSGTVDVWGCEQDMVLPCLSPILSNSVRSFCDSPHCPQGEKVLQRSSLLILNGELERRDNKSYLELMLELWLHPPPEPCNAEFPKDPPPTAVTRRRETLLLASDTLLTQAHYCGGARTSDSKEFNRGPPWVLPIFLGNLGNTEKLNGPEELPLHLHLLNSTYSLGGLTFWNGAHYIGRLLHHGKWYDYDGMHKNPLRSARSMSDAVPVGFILTSCIYFMEQH